MPIYKNESLRHISFPLGGIGSGSLGLAGNGELIDWEILNHPAKGKSNGYSHMSIRTRTPDGKIDARILQGDHTWDLPGQRYVTQRFCGYGYGPKSGTMAGLPHFRDCTFRGEFPITQITFGGEDFPLNVSLTAFNPLIPMDPDASSFPAAFFEIHYENTTAAPLDISVSFSACNIFGIGRNEAVRAPDMQGIRMTKTDAAPDHPDWGELVIATDDVHARVQSSWYRGDWQDAIQTYWREFSEFRPLPERSYDTDGKDEMATLCVDRTLAANEKGSVRFILAWYVPRRINTWYPYKDASGNDVSWKNYYAVLWNDATHIAEDGLRRWDELYARTDAFRRALFASTLDSAVIDAAASNLAVLKSPTCLRLEDGSFWGWEGVMESYGSCPGTCTHVWNYAYALAFLFPSLERSIREMDYRYNMLPDGALCFRLPVPPRQVTEALPCADGQFGGILRTYREWKLSGNTDWLRTLWPQVKRALEYAWHPDSAFKWDRNKDGVLEGRQHHTLDMELFGPSGWLEGFYLAALKACAEIAEAMGEADSAAAYRELFAQGSAWTEENLFNGKWYIQKVNLKDRTVIDAFNAPQYWNEEAGEMKYQIGDGCEIDQMCAQWHAYLIGLGDIFDPAHRATALDSLLRYNFVPAFRDFANTWRLFGLNDEAGAIMCTWPDGAYEPVIPLPYNSESMHGFEYQLAGLAIAEGRVEDGIKLVRAIRDRYAGHNRNPYNEMECGSNYARSMASWALIPLFSGFTYDMTQGEIGFSPKRKHGETFSTVWSVDGVWGTITMDDHSFVWEKCEGDAPITTLRLPMTATAVTAEGGNATLDGDTLHITQSVRKVIVEY